MNVYMWRITVEASTKMCWSWFDKLYPNLGFCVAIAESVNAISKNDFTVNGKPSKPMSFYSDVFMTVNQTLVWVSPHNKLLITDSLSKEFTESTCKAKPYPRKLHGSLYYCQIHLTRFQVLVFLKNTMCEKLVKFCLNLEQLTSSEFVEQDILNVLWTVIQLIQLSWTEIDRRFMDIFKCISANERHFVEYCSWWSKQ